MEKRVYDIFPRSADRSDCIGRLRPEFHITTPSEAWSLYVARLTEAAQDPAPADHIVVGLVLTGEVDKNGAHMGQLDWDDVHDPCSFAPAMRCFKFNDNGALFWIAAADEGSTDSPPAPSRPTSSPRRRNDHAQLLGRRSRRIRLPALGAGLGVLYGADAAAPSINLSYRSGGVLMAVVAYHALFVEVHDDGRVQVRTEDAHLKLVNGRLSKVVDGHTASEMGTPQDAADQVTVAARALAGQLASTPNRDRAPLAMEAN